MKLLCLALVLVVSSETSWFSYKEAEMVPIIVPKQALDIVKKFEGLRLVPYKDAVGKPTVGYGHYNLTPPPCDGCTVITEEIANGLLHNDLEHVITRLHGLISVDLNDNQMAAIASFAFNLGVHAFANSTLLDHINNGDFNKAAEEFLKWNKAGGKVLKGLVDRRIAERELFLKNDQS